MSSLLAVAVAIALLGSALIGAVFFAFSSFVMKSLARVPSAEGISAMQSINVVVLNPSFLGAFMGTAVVSVWVAGLAIQGWGTPSAPWFVAGAVSYLLGTFVVTMMGNVPLNNRLAAVSAVDSGALAVWEHYLVQWTRLNSIRAASAMGAALLFTVGLLQSA